MFNNKKAWDGWRATTWKIQGELRRLLTSKTTNFPTKAGPLLETSKFSSYFPGGCISLNPTFSVIGNSFLTWGWGEEDNNCMLQESKSGHQHPWKQDLLTLAICAAIFFFWWMWRSGRVINVQMRVHILWTFITHLLVHIHQKKKIAAIKKKRVFAWNEFF